MRKFGRIVSLLLVVVLLFLCVPYTPRAEAAAEVPGDLNGDGYVTDEDVIYLLWHTVFPEEYPLDDWADFNDNGIVTDADVIYLLWHTAFPVDYPLVVEPDDRVFKAGFGMVDISPKNSVPLSGYGASQNRMSTGNYSTLEARCVAVRDTEGQILFFLVADIINAPIGLGNTIRNDLSRELGIPAEHVIISGTHTHASVDTGLTNIPSVVEFNQSYVAGMKAAAYKALEDLKPAEVYVGSAQTQGMNFVRRYFMDDGSLIGDNAYGTGTRIVRHETDADPEMQMMKFVREGGKDILISQFQAHPHLEGKTTNISAQTVGAIRDAVEKNLDAYSLHWQIQQVVQAEAPAVAAPAVAGISPTLLAYGEKMADYIETVYSDLKEVKTGPVKVMEFALDAPANHVYDEYLIEANMVKEYFNAGHTAGQTATYAHQLSADRGLEKRINSYYHANRIVSNSTLGSTVTIQLAAWSFGEVGGFVNSYEMFDTTGMYIKENSPFEITFVVGYSYPGGGGYIPDKDAFPRGGYEADNCMFAPGAAELIADKNLEMLNEMFEN